MPVIIRITLNQSKMKKIFFIVALLATVFVQQSFAQDSTKTQPSPLLISYYNLKDALVSSNPTTAAASADAQARPTLLKSRQGRPRLPWRRPEKSGRRTGASAPVA